MKGHDYLAEWDGGWLIRPTEAAAHDAALAAGIPEDEFHVVPNTPDLIGVSEVGQLLGVSRQRAHQLTKGKGFPKPTAKLVMGPVWRRTAIERWIAKR